MSQVTSDPLVGRTVDGRYDVLRMIARGGMATVYLAHDRRLERDVALKVVHPHLADGAGVIARFRREARAAARLAHPGIVAVLDQGLDGDVSYLTMEYVSGRTLRTEIAGHGALTLGRSLEITIAVLDALAAAHRAGLVHRDVKPENVLLASDGRIKVADFGLARAASEATAVTTGTLLGTVAYLSPEIVSSGEANAAADVYAVGVMLYEMLTGTPPFTGSSPIQIAYRHVHDVVPPPSDAVPWLPMDVDELVAALTARDLDTRPADAVAALALVRSTLAGLDDRATTLRADVTGRPELLVVPDEPNEIEHRPLPADHDATTALDRGPGTGTIALPIGAVADPARSGSPGEPASAATARTPRRRRRVLPWVLSILLVLLLTGAGTAWYFLIGPGARASVPALVGLTQEQATTALTQRDLEVTTSQAYDDDAPVGTVVSSDPGVGTRLPLGTSVELVISLGIEMVTVPSLDGLDEAGARAAIEEAGLAVQDEVDEAADRTIPTGQVVSATPAPGESVSHDTAVRLTISTGPELVEIPTTYLGQPSEDVVADLARVLDIEDTAITVTDVFSEDVPTGAVVSVFPEPGTQHPQGTAAAVEVSKGPELFEVPNVQGKQIGEATEILEDLGFVVEEDNFLGGFFGTVRVQSVEAGSMQPRGTTIVLTVV